MSSYVSLSIIYVFCVTICAVKWGRWKREATDREYTINVLNARVEVLRADKKLMAETILHYIDLIGKPEDTVFLPEKSYWDDMRLMREEIRTLRNREHNLTHLIQGVHIEASQAFRTMRSYFPENNEPDTDQPLDLQRH